MKKEFCGYINYFSLDKETGKLQVPGVKMSPNMQIIFLTDTELIIKCAGYSSYVHRGIGVEYVPARYNLYKIKEIKNYENTIKIYVEPTCIEIEIKGLKNTQFIAYINENYPVQEYKPTSKEQRYIDYWKEHPNKLEQELNDE